MIIDTSAIIAILRNESEASSCAQAISDAMTRPVSAIILLNQQLKLMQAAIP